MREAGEEQRGWRLEALEGEELVLPATLEHFDQRTSTPVPWKLWQLLRVDKRAASA